VNVFQVDRRDMPVEVKEFLIIVENEGCQMPPPPLRFDFIGNRIWCQNLAKRACEKLDPARVAIAMRWLLVYEISHSAPQASSSDMCLLIYYTKKAFKTIVPMLVLGTFVFSQLLSMLTASIPSPLSALGMTFYLVQTFGLVVWVLAIFLIVGLIQIPLMRRAKLIQTFTTDVRGEQNKEQDGK